MKSTFLTVALALAATSCSFHSTARSWNGRVGVNGNPVYVKSTTNVGFNLGIIIPLLGNTEIHSMVDEMTEEIAVEDGDRVRIIESAAENYWYGFPPFTWILTPVITTVTADYEPTPAQLEADRLEREAEDS